jgi:hypothetical protein
MERSRVDFWAWPIMFLKRPSYPIIDIMSDRLRTFSILLLMLAVVVQGNAWTTTCGSDCMEEMEMPSCHMPEAEGDKCADATRVATALDMACCCAIAVCSDLEQEPIDDFVIESLLKEQMAFDRSQMQIGFFFAPSSSLASHTVQQREAGPGPPLFVLNSSYLN